jgi:negative regulator of sigma E activity
VDQLSRQLGFTITVPSFLPGGFKLLGGMPGPYGRAGVLNYSDGVREFSVSVAKRPLNRPGSPAAQGAGHAVLAHWPRRTVAVAVRGDFFYLVGGQLPAETLQRIAASIP